MAWLTGSTKNGFQFGSLSLLRQNFISDKWFVFALVKGDCL
jgi:hypothetical protein